MSAGAAEGWVSPWGRSEDEVEAEQNAGRGIGRVRRVVRDAVAWAPTEGSYPGGQRVPWARAPDSQVSRLRTPRGVSESQVHLVARTRPVLLWGVR